MPEIEAYDDYRDFLKDSYEERRKVASYFSYRFIGNRVGMDSSYVTRLFQKKVHVVEDQIPRLAKLFDLPSAKLEYFECLVAFNKARTDAEAKTFHDKLQSLRDVAYVELERDRREFFGSWHAVALRNVLDMSLPDLDEQRLADLLDPPISVEQVRLDLGLLERLGLARQDDGIWSVPDTHLHSGIDHGDPAVRRYQSDTMDLAKRSLEAHAPRRREIGTMTMNIGADQLSDLRILVSDFFKNVARLVDDGSPSDRVYQLNLQLFPLTRLPEDAP